MTPTSLPVTPAQPDQPWYGLDSLNLFGTWTRQTFEAAFGQQAPPYDPSQPTRTWFDTSPTPGPYTVVQVHGSSAAIVPMAVPQNVRLPNLPGLYNYPAWENPQTTVAQLLEPNFPAQPFGDPASLCSLADAAAVQVALPAGTTITEAPMEAQIIWGAETRRMYLLSVPNGPLLNAAYLRAAMTQQIIGPNGYEGGGVGAPGAFTISGITATWSLTHDAGANATPPIAVPCRALLPDESFQPAAMGMGVMIMRSNPQAAPAQFSAAQLVWVLQVMQALNVAQKLGMPAPPAA